MGKKDQDPNWFSQKKRSSGRGWLWLALFFGALWGVGYLVYQYEPAEILEKLQKPVGWIESKLSRFVSLKMIPIGPGAPFGTQPAVAPAVPFEPKPAEKKAAPVISLPDDRELGITSYNDGQFEKAVEYFQKSLEQDPNQREPYFYLGEIAFKKDDFSGAAGYFEKALQLDA